MLKVLGHRVVVVIGVDGPEGVREVPQLLRQVLVRAGSGSDQGLATIGREVDAAQRGSLRRVHHEGHIRVPVVGRAVLAVHGQDILFSLHGRNRGVGLGERAKVAGKLHLGFVAEDVRLAEHQRLVFVQRSPDLGDGFLAKVSADVQATDFGADAGAEFGELQFGFGNDGHGSFLTCCDGCGTGRGWV
ncbi:hypothetical protein D3C73_1193870 [compost metagenome]